MSKLGEFTNCKHEWMVELDKKIYCKDCRLPFDVYIDKIDGLYQFFIDYQDKFRGIEKDGSR